MPLHTYRCTRGHQFDALVKLDGSNAPKTCRGGVITEADIVARFGAHGVAHSMMMGSVGKACEEPVEKVLAPNAKLFPGADSWRK